MHIELDEADRVSRRILEDREHGTSPKGVIYHRLLDAVSEGRCVVVPNLWWCTLYVHDYVEHVLTGHHLGLAELVGKLPLACLEADRMPRREVGISKPDEFGATVEARRECDTFNRDGVSVCGHELIAFRDLVHPLPSEELAAQEDVDEGPLPKAAAAAHEFLGHDGRRL